MAKQISNGVNHNHDNTASCPHCAATKNQIGGNVAFGGKLRAFLGVCGCFSCYVAMFPAMLVSLVGVLGVSTVGITGLLTVYQQSFLFQPIFIISLVFLLLTVFPYGRTSFLVTLTGSTGAFVSMNFFMQQWLFTLSFALIALGYFLAYRKTGSMPMKLGFVLLILVVFIGILDIGRVLFFTSQSKINQPVNQMNGMR